MSRPSGFHNWDPEDLKKAASEGGKKVPAEKRFFAANPKAAKKAAKKGGKISRRGPAKPKETAE